MNAQHMHRMQAAILAQHMAQNHQSQATAEAINDLVSQLMTRDLRDNTAQMLNRASQEAINQLKVIKVTKTDLTKVPGSQGT